MGYGQAPGKDGPGRVAPDPQVARNGRARGRLVASGIGMALVGTLLIAGGLWFGEDDASAPLVTQPMDEGILEFEFAGSPFDNGYFSTDALIGEQDYLNGDYDQYSPMFIVGEPYYGDFDGDNDLDAALQVAPAAGGATPVLYVWLWDGGDVVQVPYPAAWPSDCADRDASYSVVDDRIEVEMQIGDWCSTVVDPVHVTFTVAVQDGFPVQVDPGFGAVQQCSNHDHLRVIDEPGEIPLHVAQSAQSPTLEAADYEHIEVLDFTDPYGAMNPEWRLARVTGRDGIINCAWTPLP